ncbi:MAG: heterodisulfide reductase-related iron-sulfur binding cluster [Candidatus Hadarchaeales archaeon]
MPPKTETIKKWHKLSYLCAHCRACAVGDYHKLGRVVNNCPSGTYFGHEAFYSYGKMELVRGLNEDIITVPTQAFLNVVYGCTLCGSCSVNCKEHSGLGYKAEDTVKIMEDLRAYLAEIGWGPLPAHVKYGESVRVNHNPYHEPSQNRAVWANGSKYPRKAETIYFVGCTASYRQQMIARSTVEIFKKLGIEFGLLGEDEWCCGSPLLRTGQRKLAEEVAKHNMDVLKDAGAKRVITSCGGCYKTLKLDYPKMFGLQPDFEILTTAEFLDLLLREGKLRFSNPINLHVTYHDPCHSGRHVSIYLSELEKEKVFEPPRNVLKSLPGIKFTEMLRNRELSWCCGAGGGVKSAYPEWAIWTATERLKEAQETGAQAIVSTCPFCRRNLSDAVEASNIPLQVYDLTELVAKAL